MIGARGHDIGNAMSAENLAQKMSDMGFEAVQLVAYKAIEGISNKAGFLSPGLAYKIAQEFHKKNIHIGLIGSYFNLLDKDSLYDSIERFKEYLKYAKDFGCHMVGTETGSYRSDWTYHPDNHSQEALDIVIEIIGELVEEAKNHGVFVAVEGAYHHVVSTPKRMKKLLESINSTNILVILDPVNLLNINNYKECNNIIKEAFELYGEKIVLIHAKDFIIKDNKMVKVPIGKGLMDYEFIIDIINKYKPGLDIIIENQQNENLIESLNFLKKIT